MDVTAIIVALAFGLLTGWLLGRQQVDPRPVVLAFVVGIVTGFAVRIGGLGADSDFVGGALLLGCTAALVGLAPHLLRSPEP